jgi:hypothetical protein
MIRLLEDLLPLGTVLFSLVAVAVLARCAG